MRELSTEEIDREVALVSDTLNWPYMCLPVKRLDGSYRVGVILHTASYPYDVFECNIFEMEKSILEPLRKRKKPNCPVHHYNSFRQVVEDGWVGD